jgi:hypothetical protein
MKERNEYTKYDTRYANLCKKIRKEVNNGVEKDKHRKNKRNKKPRWAGDEGDNFNTFCGCH